MPNVDINYAAVVLAAVVNMIVGAAWYSPALFGKQWSKLMGRSMEEMRSRAGMGYGITAVAALAQGYILAHFVQYVGSTTASEGAQTGFWLWVGFVAVTMAVNTVFAGSSWKLWRINAGYFLVVLLLNGALLAVM